MIEKTIELYTFDELNDDVKTELYHKWNADGGDNCNIYSAIDEADDTINKFARYFDLDLWGISYNSVYNNDFKFYTAYNCIDNEASPGDLTPARLRKWVINNYSDYYETGKYYSTRGHIDKNGRYTYKSRRSNIIKSRDCVLTGVWCDEAILGPLYDFIDGKTEYSTYYDLMHDCISSFLRAIDADIEYYSSRDFFDENIGIIFSDALFFNSGVKYAGV